ncbi:UDP-glucuronosyltransferase 2C1-like [Calliphora vicina]|uniref:UDP-glucuronosyltransferase 2C1-like n=1 Tax=Calliphora vicina TaxID=7373 RepID=UPI00325B96EE
MGGTKSHKIPFWELANGLIKRGHQITFVNGFKPDFHIKGLREVTPKRLVNYIKTFTDWDLVGGRLANKAPIPIWQALHYPAESCNSLLETDAETGVAVTDELLTQKFHLAIVDGAFPECALGIVHRLSLPFMFINTVGFYTGSLAIAGNPIAYAVTPHVFTALTQTMHLLQRVQNYVTHILADLLHMYYTNQVHDVLIAHLGSSVPHPFTMARNVSFILQNGHAIVTNPRPYYPNVAEIACIHCRPAVKLSHELEEFVERAPAGVIFFSMGSSVKPANMPEKFRKLLVKVFARLPQYHILWKWDENFMTDIPKNIYLSGWLPQQDILGQRKLKAFITHGGLLSMYEAIYHGVPMVMLPIFCDHDVNAAKAEQDGYAIRLSLEIITADKLYHAILAIINNDKYKREINAKRQLLLDHMNTPLDTAVFWTEYVLRHQDITHLQSPVRYMSFFIYYSLDVIVCFVIFVASIFTILKKIVNYASATNRKIPRNPQVKFLKQY